MRRKLISDGDFRSPECVNLLKEADIVITNPPFSLFREFIGLLMKYDKKFIIIGSKNSITCKEIFPLLMHNKIRLGYNSVKEFETPTGEIKRFGNIGWFTNLDIRKRHESMTLSKRYNVN